jgi:hypothetical protein|tara:strand:- start:99 stop:536 length:438 start_codon:yes stop_codon:yes gene_type:complete
MEEMVMQSGMVELGLWEIFAQARQANATTFLATVIAVWIAARFSSVLMEKGPNLLAKVICTAFAFGVFLLAFNNGLWITGTMEGTAAALANLDVVNGAVDISAGSQGLIDNVASNGNIIGKVGAWLFFVSGLLIAVVPLWFNPND